MPLQSASLGKDAVHSGNQPRSVRTVVAMDEDCAVLLLFFNQVQDFGDVFRFDIPRQQRAVDDVDVVWFEMVVVIAVEKAQIATLLIPCCEMVSPSSGTGCSLR